MKKLQSTCVLVLGTLLSLLGFQPPAHALLFDNPYASTTFDRSIPVCFNDITVAQPNFSALKAQAYERSSPQLDPGNWPYGLPDLGGAHCRARPSASTSA